MLTAATLPVPTATPSATAPSLGNNGSAAAADTATHKSGDVAAPGGIRTDAGR
jgi:hypothetical protein